jgi:putative transcriptional regulator
MDITNLANHLLIAMPGLKDPTFSKTVVYIYEYSEEGAIGVVINKPMQQVTLENVIDHLDIAINSQNSLDIPVLMGGPVGQEHGFILYKDKDEGPDEEICISASQDMLADIACQKGPEVFIVALGYSGWGPGQLDAEIAHNDWLIVPANSALLFDTPIDERWRKSAESIGVDITQLSTHTGHS